MKRALVFAVVAAVALGLPIIAYSKDGTIPLDLTFTTAEDDATSGTIAGTFGGVPVEGRFAGDEESGDWVLTVDGQLFAAGTYTCADGGCVFSGTTLMGRSTSFEFASLGLNGTITGDLQGLFRNHGAWVSTVARWSNTNLAPGRVGKIVSGAARLQTRSRVLSTGGKILSPGSKVRDDTASVQRGAAKVQGSQSARGGKNASGIEPRGRANRAPAGDRGKAVQETEMGEESRGKDRAAGQGTGGQENGGQGNGHSGGNGRN